jgi:hypothetical protein
MHGNGVGMGRLQGRHDDHDSNILEPMKVKGTRTYGIAEGFDTLDLKRRRRRSMSWRGEAHRTTSELKSFANSKFKNGTRFRRAVTEILSRRGRPFAIPSL